MAMWEFTRPGLGAESPPPTPEEIKDPGFFLSREDLNDYADKVNHLVTKMHQHLYAHENDLSDNARAYFVKPWLPFKLDWEDTYKEVPGAIRKGIMWTKIREAHKRALEHRHEFETFGVQFAEAVAPGVEKPLDAPKPPNPHAEDEKEEREEAEEKKKGKGGIGFGLAVLGVAAGGVLAVAGYGLGKLVGVAYGRGR